jgi:glycyl-tRNA synthetase
MSDQSVPTLETISALAKRRGFVYPTSEIYGGLANSYDYGPLGSELLRNIRNLWWQTFIHRRTDMVGLDSQIMLHPQTWVASGHVASFTDPLVEDKVTHKRYRADHLIKEWLEQHPEVQMAVEDMKTPQMAEFIREHSLKSPEGNDITEPKDFNILFETAIGSVAGEKSKVYLRGETAQGIFSNFKQILDSSRVQLPFGVGQIGKSFRNEITTGQFVFRTLEFEQAEIEYFFDPEQTPWQDLMTQWKDAMWQFVSKGLGIKEENLRWRQHTDTERSHYSLDTYDMEYLYPFGWKELWGVAYRTDYDLKQHIQFSKQNLEYTDPHSGRKFVPHVLEPAVGVNRLFLMVLMDAYWFDQERNRSVLRLHPRVAPYTAAVFPLLKNKPELIDAAKKLFQELSGDLPIVWDDRGNIGKRYLSQDEIGTPVCLTVDFQTLEDQTVTWRDRDTTEQKRIAIADVLTELQNLRK